MGFIYNAMIFNPKWNEMHDAARPHECELNIRAQVCAGTNNEARYDASSAHDAARYDASWRAMSHLFEDIKENIFLDDMRTCDMMRVGV